MAAGAATPPLAADQSLRLDNSASPLPNASTDDIRTWAIGMFNEHENILKRIVERQNADKQSVDGDVAALAAHVRTLETGILNVNGAAVAADGKLRGEILEYSKQLAGSEAHIKAVQEQLSEHVQGAFTAASMKLQQWTKQIAASTATSSSTTGDGLGLSGEVLASAFTAQGAEIPKSEELIVSVKNRVDFIEASLVELIGKPCHCPCVDEVIKLTATHDAAIRSDHAASEVLATRVTITEGAVRQLQGVGATIRSPPPGGAGPDLLPDPWAAATGRAASSEPQRPPGIVPAARVYRRIENYEKLFDDKAASNSTYECSGTVKESCEKWRKRLRGYFISRSPVLARILGFVEKKEMKHVTLEEIEAEGLEQGWMVEDFPRLSELIWGFLNTCLKQDAKDKFEVADDLDGFNAWRLVVLSIRSQPTSGWPTAGVW